MRDLVLHLEDDYSVRMAFKLAFKTTSHKLIQFCTPSEVNPELYIQARAIISDYDMLNETALDLLTYLRDNKIKTPVIMTSGDEGNYDKIKKVKLDKNIVFWANKMTPINDIIIMINNLKNGFTN